MKNRTPDFLIRAASLLSAVILTAVAVPVALAQTAPTKIASPGLIEQQIATSGKSRVIVQLSLVMSTSALGDMLKQKASRPEALSRIRSIADAVIRRNFPAGRTAAGSTIKRFTLLPSFAAEVSRADLERLKADPNVLRIEPDEIRKTVLNTTLPLTGLPAGQNSPSTEPSGYGRTIAVIDTGVDSSHPFISPRVVAEACYLSAARCPNGAYSQTGTGASAPASGQSHGTHVAGIAMGSYGAGATVYRGVANRAGLVMVNVFGSQGGAYTSDIIRGLEFIESLVSTNGNPYHIDSINMSLGGGMYSAPCDSDATKPVIDLLRSEGVLTVVAAGNGSSRTQMSSPGCISSVVSVAATNKQAGVASYTNVNAYTTLFAPGGDFDALGCVTSAIPSNGYASMCGTSMAAPHVAGAIGLLRQAKPDASVTEILAALTASNIPMVSDTRTGGTASRPFLKVNTAIANLGNQVVNSIAVTKGVSGSGTPSGTVTSSPGGISCGATCTGAFPGGAAVTLTASAGERSRFAGWSGACSGTDPSCTVTLPLTASASTNVTALFSDTAIPLNTALDDTLAWSTVPTTSDVGGWYGQNTVTRSGDSTGAARSASIGDNVSSSVQTTVTGPGTLSYYWSVSSEANYDFLRFYVDGVLQPGAISGSVGFTQQTWSIPAGSHVLKWTYAKDYVIAAGADAGYLDTVIFTATPASKTNTLSLAKTNGNYGTVTSTPAGIACGPGCNSASAVFAANAKVRLQAKAVPGKRFSSWGGACSGNGATCTVTMSASKSVTATFR